MYVHLNKFGVGTVLENNPQSRIFYDMTIAGKSFESNDDELWMSLLSIRINSWRVLLGGK